MALSLGKANGKIKSTFVVVVVIVARSRRTIIRRTTEP